MSIPAGAGECRSVSSSATICAPADSNASGGIAAFMPAIICSIIGTIIVSRICRHSAWSFSRFSFFCASTCSLSPSSGPTSHHGRSTDSMRSPSCRYSSMLYPGGVRTNAKIRFWFPAGRYVRGGISAQLATSATTIMTTTSATRRTTPWVSQSVRS